MWRRYIPRCHNPAIQEKDRQPLEQSYKLSLDQQQQQEAEYDLMDIEEENTGAHQDFTGLDYKEGREDSGQASTSTAGSSPGGDLDKREKDKILFAHSTSIQQRRTFRLC